MDFQGGHGKFEWKSRRVNFKKSISSTRGGGSTFSWKSPLVKDVVYHLIGEVEPNPLDKDHLTS